VTSSAARVVVLAPNWLGDAVMALPALADIRAAFPRSALFVAARAGLAQLFELVPGVDGIVTLAQAGSPGRRRRQAVRALSSEHFDLAILFPNSFSAAWIARRARVAERWGYRGDLRGALLTRAMKRPRRKVHVGMYYQHLVRELGMPTGPLTPHVAVPEHDRRAAGALLEQQGWVPSMPLVGLAPGAAFGFAKQWPPERFAAVAARLVEQGVGCVLVGHTSDRAAGQRLVAAFERSAGTALRPGRMLNLVGRTDLRQLMGLLTHCTTIVSHDSGAAHLAAAIGLPVVAIFGPTDERYSAPLPGLTMSGTHAILSHDVFCRPCFLRECPIDHRCMNRIEPSRVFDAVMRQLGAR
jgi:lipopolysaccharide heptosyltransferase II